MQSSTALAGSDFDRTRCATHPELPGVAICSRCGDYHCARCHKQIADRALCATCRGLPGVDYLEDTRQRFWGKRDGYTWYLGLLGPVMILSTLPTLIRTGDSGHVVASIAWMGVLIAYFAQIRAMRLGLLVLNVVDMFVNVVRMALGLTIIPTDNTIPPAAAVTIQALGTTVAMLIALAAYRSPRNKLAFKIAIDDGELQRVYDRYLSNPLALRAAAYAIPCCMIPFASVVTLLMGLRALRVANSETWPPRGGRLPALIGVVLSSIASLCWAALLVLVILRRMQLH